jgi:hypothetical protein
MLRDLVVVDGGGRHKVMVHCICRNSSGKYMLV